jgi:hypothetical protein
MHPAIATVGLVVFVAIADIGLARWSPAEHVAPAVPMADIEQRFAIKFCYRQYTNQTDVNQCLLRNARLGSWGAR